MSEAGSLKPEVVERPDNIEVLAPSGPHTLLEPFALFNESSDKSRTALIILNQPIKGMNLPKLWDNTQLHVCADGGANQLYNYFDEEEERSKYIPHFISGDCDSLIDEVRSYYESKGTIVIPQTTQYSTDYMKAVTLVKLYLHSEDSKKRLFDGPIESHDGLTELLHAYSINPKIEQRIQIYVLGGIGGRFDHTIHSINQLYKLNKTDPFIQQFLITETDFIFLLKKGKNYISYPSKSSFTSTKVPICGLLPLGNTSVILNSYGLKYDVLNWPSSLYGHVSSSNGLSGINGVIVDTTEDLTVNIEIEHFS